jgi:hypothetical protein
MLIPLTIELFVFIILVLDNKSVVGCTSVLVLVVILVTVVVVMLTEDIVFVIGQ